MIRRYLRHTGNYLRRAPFCPIGELCPDRELFDPIKRVKGKPTYQYQVKSLFLPLFLKCVAKVQTYLETCKHFPEKVYIFNLLQQIKLFLPKFIHILSTKLAKCAIYKAKLFAFRLQYACSLYKD